MTAQVKGTTQNFIEIENIRDDIVIMRDGSAALVIETSAVNFGLLSEREQDALIYSFAAFINSLSFPIQILIHSRKMDISNYLNLIADQIKKQETGLLKIQTQKYYEFIQNIVQDNEVLEKRFFIVVPFSVYELGIKGGVSGSKATKLPYPIDYIVKRAKTALLPKRDHVIRQISRLGLRGQQLNTEQLIELHYALFNKDTSEGEKIIDSEQYTRPIITGQ
ncbi:MAG: hypothetical protein Q8Q65_02625 [bacterium]|nr:hypothetical protein [bacterium]